MKVMNRMMISSALLVFISLAVMIAVIIGILFIPFIIYGDYGASDMSEKDSYAVGKTLDSFNVSSENWEELNDELYVYGYKLCVIDDKGEALFLGTRFNNESITALNEVKFMEDVRIGIISDKYFVACKTEGVILLALKDRSKEAGNILSNISFFALFVSIAVGVILFLSQIFIRKMAWRILKPLNALAEGARRIIDGDLNRPIEYIGNDEFSEVCTAFNHMQKSLAIEREKTAAYEKSRTDMIVGISHDLRTPLTSVKGYIKGLRDGVAYTPEKRDRYLSIAYRKACDIDMLLQKLFDFSKMETGNLPLSLVTLDLGDFARQFAEEEKFASEQKNIKLTVDITDAPHPVHIDPEQMKRVLLNLTENAIKYSESETLEITISVCRKHNKEYLRFKDNGVGVDENLLPNLFDRFWRGDEARGVKNGDSNGLGLFIVKYIIEAHGGTVSAKNDKGLAYEITLPCAKDGENE